MGEGESIRVLVADDHALYRRGLEMVLGAEEGIEIVGEAATVPRRSAAWRSCFPTSC